MADDEDQMNTPINTRAYLSSSPGPVYHARMRSRHSRARMLSQFRRRGAEDATAGDRPVARVLTYDDNPDLSPSTSMTRPNTANQSVQDYQRELQRRDAPGWEQDKDLSPQQANERILVNKLVHHARTSICLDERELVCLNCGFLPLMPVTGMCGHTRCYKCIQQYETCPCGSSHTPWLLNVNVMIQEILDKIMATETDLREWISTSQEEVDVRAMRPAPPVPPMAENALHVEIAKHEGRFPTPLIKKQVSTTADKPNKEPSAPCDYEHNGTNTAIKPVAPDQTDVQVAETPDNHAEEEEASDVADLPTRSIDEMETSLNLYRIPITPEARLRYASHLIEQGQLLKAGPHLARVACAPGGVASTARRMLQLVISELSKTLDVKELENDLWQAISAQATKRCLSPRDLECVFCCDSFRRPVTTPCGHTFCRQCLERSLDYRTTCALCIQILFNFNLPEVCLTEFVHAALIAIGASPQPPQRDPNFIPILACTVAFPGLPSPLFLFKPRYWYMIRRILESESRRFGVVANEREGGLYSDYGTILELRDCVHLQNGCTVVSTIGICRFRVVERDIFDGWCDVARVEPLVDIPISNEATVQVLRTLARHISFKAALWIRCFSYDLRAKIQRSCGAMPQIDVDGDWWRQPDGPVWLWWIISILPLPMEIKILILATNCLAKRMRVVLRTLDLSLVHARQSLYEYELTLADWWQQRQL